MPICTAIRGLRNIRNLNLADNKIGFGGCCELAEVFRANCAIKKVKLGNNYLEDDSIKVICEALVKNQSITYLDLSKEEK